MHMYYPNCLPLESIVLDHIPLCGSLYGDVEGRRARNLVSFFLAPHSSLSLLYLCPLYVSVLSHLLSTLYLSSIAQRPFLPFRSTPQLSPGFFFFLFIILKTRVE